MAFRLTLRLASRLLRPTPTATRRHHHYHSIFTATLGSCQPAISIAKSQSLISFLPESQCSKTLSQQTILRLFSTATRRVPSRSSKVDIGARARQMQNRRLWTYALTFSCVAGFIIIVLNQFQDQLIFYVTPTDALEKFKENPTKNKFRLGGLVLEGSVEHPSSSPEMEFVITDLINDMLVRYQGSLPDLFREGHSVVVEGFVKPFTDGIRREGKNVSKKARKEDCYFSAIEVLAKHDEKYMPGEVAEAIEKNKKKLEEEAAGHERRVTTSES